MKPGPAPEAGTGGEGRAPAPGPPCPPPPPSVDLEGREGRWEAVDSPDPLTLPFTKCVLVRSYLPEPQIPYQLPE